MSENLHLVFSKPPEAISDEAYNPVARGPR